MTERGRALVVLSALTSAVTAGVAYWFHHTGDASACAFMIAITVFTGLLTIAMIVDESAGTP